MQTRERKAQSGLLNAYVELCPTQEDRDSIRKFSAKMHAAGETDLAICKAIAGKLVDGLYYGNWPSNIAAMQKRSAR